MARFQSKRNGWGLFVRAATGSGLILAGIACGTNEPGSAPDGASGGGAADGSTGGTASGGSDSASSGGAQAASGGAMASGGSSAGGSSTGGATPSGGAGAGGAAASGGATGAGGDGVASGGGPDGAGGAVFSGTCTASEQEGALASGSGPHKVVIETNPDPGIEEGTIFRPENLGDGPFPLLVWGQGGCSQDGLANRSAMVEIASHGYIVVADGVPNGTGNRPMNASDLDGMGAPLIGYIDWVLAENEKPCSAFYQNVQVDMVAANGFSCGGLMAQGTVTDPRIVTWGVTSSGMAGAQPSFYEAIHTPVLFVEGGPDEVAYDGALKGYETIAADLDVPVMWFSKNIGHGGDLWDPDGGDFTKINLAWLNWWLKGDEGATGKGVLVGASCSYCTDSEWEVMSANVP